MIVIDRQSCAWFANLFDILISSYHHPIIENETTKSKTIQTTLSLFLLEIVQSLVLMQEGLQLFLTFYSLQIEGKCFLGFFGIQCFCTLGRL